MPIALTCPQCQAPQTVPDESAGQTVRCPSCQAEFQAESASLPAAPAPGKRHVVLWIVLLLLLVGGGLGAYLFLTRAIPTDFTDSNGLFSARFPDRPEEKLVSEAQPIKLLWGERLYRAKAGGKEY